jgi:CBS domain-containing protein
VEHLKEPAELIEEVMYETVLATRLKLQRFLPFIAISAASAPLLGLLGTVTGIINTFKLITVFGSGDVKTLSGGISEALITTEFGLIVAIPSLLLHAFLSRKARHIIDEMEKTAIAFNNQISRTPYNRSDEGNVLSQLNTEQIRDLLQNIRSRPQAHGRTVAPTYPADSAGNIMNRRVVSVGKSATVAEAIGAIRTADIREDMDTIFVVDENGRYVGHVRIHHLLTRPEQASLESLADTKPVFVRVDTHRSEVQNLFKAHDIRHMPVLDYEGRLVGRITRNGNGDGNGDGK